jgi:hypothetical protein
MVSPSVVKTVFWKVVTWATRSVVQLVVDSVDWTAVNSVSESVARKVFLTVGKSVVG